MTLPVYLLTKSAYRNFVGIGVKQTSEIAIFVKLKILGRPSLFSFEILLWCIKTWTYMPHTPACMLTTPDTPVILVISLHSLQNQNIANEISYTPSQYFINYFEPVGYENSVISPIRKKCNRKFDKEKLSQHEFFVAIYPY